MKNIFYILLLLPTIIFAQYPNNSGHKITLGEQTTADGLIWRGVAADTTLTAKSDTAAYFVLDTVNINLYTYKASATGRKWRQLGADTASIAYVNTYGTQTVNGAKTFTSVINSNVQNASFITATGTTQFVRGQMVNTGGNFVFGIGNSTGETPFSTSPYASFFVSRSDTDIAFGTNDLIRFTLKNTGRIGIALTTPTARLHIAAGTATASTAPLKFTSGTNLTTAEAGAMEFSLFNGANRLFITPESGVRKEIGYADLSNVSGTLPVANGGTNASTFTQGSVVFAGASGTYTQDNGNLFFDNTNDRLGIGTNNPISKLDISLSSIRKFLVNFDDNIITMKGANANGNPESIKFVGDGVRFHSGSSGSGTEIMRISSSNKVGILTNDPTEVLHVVGNARITAMNGIGDIGADANGVLQAATSDMNLKNTIENSPFGLNEILLLNPVTFLYNDTDRKIDSDVKEVGFIAQDVFDIIPNAVSSTGIGYLQLDYRAITATLVKAIQEQQALIKALEQRIINLENK